MATQAWNSSRFTTSESSLGLLPGSKLLNQENRRADVYCHVRRQFIGIELPKSVPRKSRRIVDEQSWRRETVDCSEYRVGASDLLEICHNLCGAGGNIIQIVMDMGDDAPAILDQGGGNITADALACAGDDCGSLGLHRTAFLP